VSENPQRPPVKKQFNAVTLLSMAFVICNSWAGISGSLQLALLEGGPATLIYSILLSTTAYFSIAASLAELASVYPTAGGQYHFTSILATQSTRRSLSYACGLLSIFSWVSIGVSVNVISAQQVMALVAALHDEFTTKSWHVFLVYQGLALCGLLYNIFALKRAPWTHNIGCKSDTLIEPMLATTYFSLFNNVC
jgi:choline transport protein